MNYLDFYKKKRYSLKQVKINTNIKIRGFFFFSKKNIKCSLKINTRFLKNIIFVIIKLGNLTKLTVISFFVKFILLFFNYRKKIFVSLLFITLSDRFILNK